MLNTCDYIHYVSMNMIPNCPVTIQDIKNAEFIRGPDLGCVKGKTVRKNVITSESGEHLNTCIHHAVIQ